MTFDLRLVIATCAALAVLMGCKGSSLPVESMTAGHAIVGASDATFEVGWQVSRDYQTQNKAALVDIVRAGTHDWVDSLVNKRCEQALLDRTLLPPESLAFQQAKLKIYTYPVAFFPVYLLVARDNPVTRIDSVQLRDAIGGVVTNWSELGGPNLRLTIYTTLLGDGAWTSVLLFFGGLDSAAVEVCSTHSALLQAAKEDPGALLIYAAPYEGLPYKRLDFTRNGIDIEANAKQIIEEPVYPFRLNLTYVTTRMKGDVAAGYLTFLTGNTGQRRVMTMGYRPASVPVRVVKLK